MNKYGFTLIEVIICLVLIIGIGTASIFGIKAVNNNMTRKELTEIQDKIYEVANVYIETNKESKNQITNNKNASVIPLSVLKDEGLIDFQDINIRDHYVLTVLGSRNREDACLETTTIGTWEVSTNKEIFLCTNQEVENIVSTTINNIISGDYVKKAVYDLKIQELEDKIKELEENKEDVKTELFLQNASFTPKGLNVNNWVELDVNGEDAGNNYVWWPKNSKEDKWRIVSIESGFIKLIYSQAVGTNNEKNYDLTQPTASYGEGYYRHSVNPLYKLKYYSGLYSHSAYYYRYNSNNIWVYNDIESSYNTENSKKQFLYNKLSDDSKKLIKVSKYYQSYFKNNAGNNIRNSTTHEDVFGTLTVEEINLTKINTESWLSQGYNNFLLGTGYNEEQDIKYYFYTNHGGTISRNEIESYAWRDNGRYIKEEDDYIYLYGTIYYPVITLKQNVKLIKNETNTCTGAKVQGSEECPYKLECNNC